MKVIKITIKKINIEPSALDMKEFGLKYNKDKWFILTNNKQFLDSFDKNLDLAQRIADKLLNNV